MKYDPNHSQWLSVIITTYNKPEYLRLVLLGFEYQINKNFEIIIADDGSDEKTKTVIDDFQKNSSLVIKHVWHEDEGFRKCTILNKAILSSDYDYLLFTDDDCIPRKDYVDVHLKKAQKGHFLSGGYFKLNEPVSKKVTTEIIKAQKVFTSKWLQANGQEFTYKFIKMTPYKWLSKFMNSITTTKPTWNGHNVSGWKDDIIAVNGYNEDMMYGGLDRELGERLMNKGIKGVQIRYSAICVHLFHNRPYRKTDLLKKNRAIRDAVKKDRITYAKNGIDQHIK